MKYKLAPSEPDRVAELEAKLKMAVDALNYYAKQSDGGYGFMARDCLLKIKQIGKVK